LCGIYAVFNEKTTIDANEVRYLAKTAQARGVDSAGIVFQTNNDLQIIKRDFGSLELIGKTKNFSNSKFIAGHSRLVTNDVKNNQPVVKEELIVIHNGIITNYLEIWESIGLKPETELDSELIPVLFDHFTKKGLSDDDVVNEIFNICEGVISAILIAPRSNKVHLISNNGSLYYGYKEDSFYVASESYPLTSMSLDGVTQVFGLFSYDYNFNFAEILVDDVITKKRNYLLPKFEFMSSRDKLLERPEHDLKRCKKCILPETMPYITFDEYGVCNYCNNYTLKNIPKPVSVLESLMEPYRRKGSRDCIVPFSGGRDSSYGLHLIVEELGMNPIAYTYDWGMVTDLGRRNISRMCSKLKVENIIVAADITKKRDNIRKNVTAWLKNPHLGMISLWTAGDKHFFRYCEDVKKETGISLNLWGVNPMETTHFKTGFLNIAPGFSNEHVYSNGMMSQLEYQYKRYKEYFKNPAYFNSSIADTLSGEYWRSINKKTDYYHIFDYWTWDEEVVDSTLKSYNWEWANDTPTSWRIGDGTAALYNYVYYTVAGFTEHDTFRSNQIREGMISRADALKLVAVENQPRYESIQWYLDSIGLDFESVINVINNIPKLYKPSRL
jgi:glucosamine--fructose-6-phosphate aminotransferase (isomerizing)